MSNCRRQWVKLTRIGGETSLGDNRYCGRWPPLKRRRRLVAERRMPTLPVIEDREVVEERRARLQIGAEGAPGQQGALQGRKEALRQGIVVARRCRSKGLCRNGE